MQSVARPGNGALEAFGKMRTSQAVMTYHLEGEEVRWTKKTKDDLLFKGSGRCPLVYLRKRVAMDDTKGYQNIGLIRD